MNCLIIDDNKRSVFELQWLLHKNGFDNVFTSVDSNIANRLLNEKNIAVIFVRTKFWHYSLLQSATCLKRQPAVVFLSVRREKFKEDLYGQVDHHLSEPYTTEKVQTLLQRLKTKSIVTDMNFLFIKYERRYYKLFFEEIELIECKAGNCIVVYTVKKKYMLFGFSLNAFMNRLPENLFIRISDQLIIPKRDSCKIKGDIFFYNGGEKKMTFKQAGRSNLKILQENSLISNR